MSEEGAPVEEPGADASLQPEVEPVEAEAEAEETEVEESEAESPPAEETEDKPDPFQERIDKLTRRFRETERDLQAVSQERDELMKKLDDIPAQTETKTLEDFDFDESKYREYLFSEAEKRATAAAEKVAKGFQEKTAQERIQEQYISREKEFAKTVPDFYDVTFNESLQTSAAMVDEIYQSDIGPELIYYLGKNPDEASRIARLPERAAVREMVLLENRLQTEKAKSADKVSKAPPPPKKIKGSEPGLNVSTTDPKSDSLSDEEWFKREEARKLKMMGK